MRQFDWDRFKNGNEIAVRCKTEEEANDFCKQMHEHGMCWCDETSYLEETDWDCYKYYTCYSGDGEYADIDCYQESGYKILEWSDYMKDDYTKKKFTKEDLQGGMVVETRCDGKYLVLGNRLVNRDGALGLEEYDDDLIAISEDNDKEDHDYDIVAVYELDTKDYPSINLVLKEDMYLKLLWKREEVKRMTSEEMKKELEKITGEKIEVEPNRYEMLGVCYQFCFQEQEDGNCSKCQFGEEFEDCCFSQLSSEELKECYRKVNENEETKN